jgi:hypothetical protein
MAGPRVERHLPHPPAPDHARHHSRAKVTTSDGVVATPRLAGGIRQAAFSVLVRLLSLLFGLGFIALTVLTLAVWAADPASAETDPVVDAGFFALGAVIVGLGFASQLRSPARNVAGLQQALIGLLALTAAGLLGDRVEPLWAGVVAVLLTLVAIVLHPARESILRPRAAVNRLPAGFAALAAVPALLYAERMLGLAREAGPSCFAGQCAAGDRLAEMAALAVTLVLVSLLASLRAPGWRLSIWSVGWAALLVGLPSAALPEVAGSLGVVGGLITAAWGASLIVATEWQVRTPDARRSPVDGLAPS